jgi:branched-chain amino acid transport system permease protein
MHEFLQQVINGLSLGAIYALIALGYTMVYGVLRFINFAHSDVFMLGAYAGWIGVEKLHFPGGTVVGGMAALLFAMTVCAVLGVVIEKLAYRPLRNRSSNRRAMSPTRRRHARPSRRSPCWRRTSWPRAARRPIQPPSPRP